MERFAKATGGSEHLSQEELKARLFLKLKEDGTINGFRALLRNELVKHLYHIEPQKVFLQPKVQPDEELLVRYPLEATNWLISEHFMRNHYDFTLSVFGLESGMPSNRQNLSIGDILTFLHIDPNSQTGRKILGAYKAKEDRLFLWTLLTASSTHLWPTKEDSGNQTVLPEKENLITVEERLRRVDDVYDLKKRALQHEENMGDGFAQLEQILMMSERQSVQKSHQLHDVDLQSFHDNKLREYQGEVDRLRRTLEEQYRYKLQLLIEREKGVQEDLEKQKTAAENDFFVQRQKMLLEISKQQQREEEWERKKRFQEKMMQIEAERMESIKKAIQNREEHLKKQEDAHKGWLVEQKQQIEASIQKKYEGKQSELDHRESELKNFQERLDAKEMLLKEKDSAHEKAIRDANETKFELACAKAKIKALQDENASLQSYANAATENIRLKAELHRLQLLNKEATTRNEAEQMRHNTVMQELLDRLAKPSPQALFLQQELGKLREQHQKESEAWYKQKSILESAVFKERSHLKSCSDRMKMQSRQMSILHKTIDDLQREILKKTSDSEIPQKHVTFQPSTETSERRHETAFRSWRETPTIDFHGTYFDTSLNPTHLPPELELGVSGLLTDSYDFGYDASYPGFTSGLISPAESVDETLARIKYLEEEAKLLERTFRSFKRNSCDSVQQTIVPNMSILSDKDKTFPNSYLTSQLKDNNNRHESNSMMKDHNKQELSHIDFTRQVSSSTPNESLAADYNAKPNLVKQRQLQEEIFALNEHSKPSQPETELISESATAPNSVSRRLSFALNEGNDLRQNAERTTSESADFVDKIVEIGSENTTEEQVIDDRLLQESTKILPILNQRIAQGDTKIAVQPEDIPKTTPINLDSAWKSTKDDSQYKFNNLSNEDAMKLETEVKPEHLNALGISQEEFIQQRVDPQGHEFTTVENVYGSRRQTEDLVFNDEADSEGHLSWERASQKSNNGDDFEW